MSKERRQAGRAAWPRRAFGFHVQFFFPYSKSPRILYRIVKGQQLQIGKWPHPSPRHRPSQIPKLVDSLWKMKYRKTHTHIYKLFLDHIPNIIVSTYPDLILQQNRQDK